MFIIGDRIFEDINIMGIEINTAWKLAVSRLKQSSDH